MLPNGTGSSVPNQRKVRNTESRASAASALQDEQTHRPETEARRDDRDDQKPRIAGQRRRLRNHAPYVHDREQREHDGGEHEIESHAIGLRNHGWQTRSLMKRCRNPETVKTQITSSRTSG